MTDPAQQLAARWLTRARSDLSIAGKLLADRANDEAWAAAFHGQQAAEKAIKAILTSNRTDFPKTHDLARLVDLLPASPAVPTSRDDLEGLSYFGTAGRYVMDHGGDREPERRAAISLVSDNVASRDRGRRSSLHLEDPA